MTESEKIQHRVMENQDWVKRWDDRAIGFHNDSIHHYLEKHSSLLLDGRSNLKIFVPLCGKSLDMKWFADQGHTVIGVEVAQKAIEEFFEEQKVSFTSQSVPAVDGTLFQSEDKKLQLYCCDLFKLSKEITGQFDAIWDRASMVAINVCDRPKYAALMQSLMAPGCRCLLDTLQYEETKYAGPPHHLSDEAVREAFETNNDIKAICSEDALEEKHKKWGIDWLTEKLYLITPK